MQPSSLSPHPISRPGWQTLGELELTDGTAVEQTVNSWLEDILSRLNLHVDFSEKVSRSAQETVSRFMQTKGAGKLEHVHLLVFIPTEHHQNKSTWGFYRIEKVEEAAGIVHPDHAIEFYLYQDGI